MDLELRKIVKSWIADDPDADTRQELNNLLVAESEQELKERFGTRLEFGTAGLRGLIGGGPNRMNRAVIRRVTRGLAEYLLLNVPDSRKRGVVLGYDARRLSPEFAEEAGWVLAGAGITVHAFQSEVSTPRLAYTCEALQAAAGIMITASHNPPRYNGYKVYWDNAAQIVPPVDTGISHQIDTVENVRDIPLLKEAAARPKGLWKSVPPDIEQAYLDRVVGLCVHPNGSREMSIVYTPLHGVGAADMGKALHGAGFHKVHMVPEQVEPDGEFPTVEFPNPEEPGAMDLALALAEVHQAELVLANDPDADRLAVALRRPEGGYRMLLGNEIGAMMGAYLLRFTKFKKQPLVCTTIVSSAILGKMAAKANASYQELLTGFKWIANKAMELEAKGDVQFLFGFEEALGYTVQDVVRDKDGVGAAVVFADLVGWCTDEGVHPLEYLDQIYREYGFHASAQQSLTLPGSQGKAKIQELMNAMRLEPPSEVFGSKITSITDFLSGEHKELASGEISRVDLPSSNVLRFYNKDGSRLLVRPSGTEPKIKFYLETVTDLASTDLSQEEIQKSVADQLAAFVHTVVPG